MNLIYAYTYKNGSVDYLTEAGLLSANPVLARVFNDNKNINVNLPDIAGATGMFVEEPQTYPASLVMAALATTVEFAMRGNRPASQGGYK